jgi:DNA-directed RNA polymerase subunit RPC12/RpoP
MDNCTICKAEIHSNLIIKDLNNNTYCDSCGKKIMRGELDLRYVKEVSK